MARVTSAKDHDIYAHQNEHGFYWVKFDADRDEKTKGYESMPVRLAKPYAGDTYGMHFPLIKVLKSPLHSMRVILTALISLMHSMTPAILTM